MGTSAPTSPSCDVTWPSHVGAALALDEIQRIPGCFEQLYLPHWSFAEMRDAFGFTLDQYLYFGGYPGAASLTDEPERWRRYIVDSLIETSISRDVLLLTRVDKPALLRRLFDLACRYSGQILSYNKMLGQLVDAGNTTTLAHYLDLLAGAGMVSGLQKYAGDAARSRGSSPKLQVLNTALMSATVDMASAEVRSEPEYRGRLVESAAAFRPNRTLLVGGDGIALDEFLARPVSHWIGP